MTETEELKLRKELERGAKARAVFESELFQEAIAVVEADTLEKWKASPVRDTEGQLALRLKWQIIQEIKGHLADVMASGKMASQQLDRELTLRERMRRSLRGTFGPRA
jgi:hypothetical protein